jgi:putative transposase
MNRSRFSEQQIVGILKEAEAGVAVKELCRKHGISDTTFYNWKAKYDGLGASELKQLRELEAENARRAWVVDCAGMPGVEAIDENSPV